MYSVDSLKVILFGDEIMNTLDMIDETYRDEEYLAVREYLEKRIEELKKNIENESTQ